jgi:CTP:molybdopterin cytidylyltransferase MocA
MNHNGITALILAAGESRRMGSPKPLLVLGEETALERSVDLFLGAGIREVGVVVGRQGDRIRRRHGSLPVKWIRNDHVEQGMFSSVQKGVAEIPPGRSWFFLLPVDIPLVKPRTIHSLMEARLKPAAAGSIFHPTFMGKRGHPPLIATSLIPGILAWKDPGGLRNFLDRHHIPAAEVPVFDEQIGRDMDTPDDYHGMCNAFHRRHIPTALECRAMLCDRTLFSEDTAAHCRRVAWLAVHFGKKLIESGIPVHIERIEAGALLHDIAKGSRNHAKTGADMLAGLGFSDISDIVASHMDIDIPSDPLPTEREIVYLADKLVQGDVLVPLSVRFDGKLSRHGNTPSARKAILKRRSDAEAIVKRIEMATAAPFETFLSDLPGENL